MTLGPRPSGLPRFIPLWAWAALKLPGRFLPHAKPAWFWVWRSWRLGLGAPKIEMFDDVNVSLIPVSAEAIAGYVDGRFPTYGQLVKEFPHAQHKVSIAVFPKDNADALDVEPGDALVSQAADWIKRQHALGKKHPIIYIEVSQAAGLLTALAKAGLRYGADYLLWTAHYTGNAHLCNAKCGFGFTRTAHATQWTDKVEGKSLDESLCSAEFFS